MSSAAADLQEELRSFSVELFELSGGLADWPANAPHGSVLVPPALATATQLPGESFQLGCAAAPGSLSVAVTGEFLDVAARLLAHAVPRTGDFCIAERYLTTRDLTEKLHQSFAWQNVRARYEGATPATAEYHAWALWCQLRSEDTWEAVIRCVVNAETSAVVDWPNVLREPDLTGAAPAAAASDCGPPLPTTFPVAAAAARRAIIRQSTPFVRRIEQRLERDRQRLRDYYRALAREANGSSRRRTSTPLDADGMAARKRAVDLELRRKLAELTERYAFVAQLRPLTLARVRIPVLRIPVVIQRKRAIRRYEIYWNSVLKRLEPLSCIQCHAATYSATFADDSVDLYCQACAHRT
ncbi:MAG: hypothetical protein U0935_08070 [Pirellulales bacterium]